MTMKTKRLKTTSNAKAQVPAEATDKHIKKCIVCKRIRMIVYTLKDKEEREITVKACDYCNFKNHSYKK